MVHYNLAGRVNSKEFTICERLLDILCASLPNFTASKTPYRQDHWPAQAAELGRLNGFGIHVLSDTVTDIIVWSDTGRLLCTDAHTFSNWARTTYGAILDLTESELTLYTKANTDELRLQLKHQQALAGR